jgi:hypothetical protein
VRRIVVPNKEKQQRGKCALPIPCEKVHKQSTLPNHDTCLPKPRTEIDRDIRDEMILLLLRR